MNKRRVWALVLSIVMVLSVFAYVPVQNVEAAGVSVQYKSHVQTFGWESAWKREDVYKRQILHKERGNIWISIRYL